MTLFEGVMNDEYFKEQAARVRSLADRADPFTKKRLLALAERYDGKRPRQTPLPDVPLPGAGTAQKTPGH
jgi:hypothetical protein